MMKKMAWIVALACVVSIASPAFATELSGFVLADDVFYPLEESFRDNTFNRALQSIALSDTQTFLFADDPVEHFLPNMILVDTAGASLQENPEDMVSVMDSLIAVSEAIQKENPDVFVLNTEMMAPYAEDGLGFFVSGTDIWLWAKNRQAVMLPVYFYDASTEAMVDDIYLLVLVTSSEGDAYCALYNDVRIVMNYIEQVEIDANADAFQRAIIYWYVENYERIMAVNDIDQKAAAEKETLGTVQVTADSINVRADSNVGAEVVRIAKHGQSFTVIDIADNGWYEIELPDGLTGFVAPALVKHRK